MLEDVDRADGMVQELEARRLEKKKEVIDYIVVGWRVNPAHTLALGQLIFTFCQYYVFPISNTWVIFLDTCIVTICMSANIKWCKIWRLLMFAIIKYIAKIN